MIWIGLAGLVVATVCAYLARTANARARAMESTETLPVQELKALHGAAAEAAGAGHFRYRCEVAGQAQPHKNGALRSELEGLECVWHKHKITRKFEETYRDSNGNRKRRTRTQVLSEHSSSTAFFVADGTGKMVIRPGDHEVTGAEKVLDRFDPHTGGGHRLELGPLSLDLGGGNGTIGYKREEWIVRPGSPCYVHGEAGDADGRLAIGAPAEGGVFIMSVKSEEQLLRGENHKVLGFGIGTAVAAVAGVVLLVVGILS
ncbi:E3 ubiquitin ligase family protein [Streptomyces halobius]|uniref:RING-type E3 ubiquitin transferase n=1 Tax=Streptomyces halobius TaxID=2879846 RepID=A0ABY4M1T4_9ACTN|nr:E3 ubiquitin ligase family protein [Streptomyces halobius]UQA90839.1 E3 ubiquitin ligase family protein [Streptomyces halobius]